MLQETDKQWMEDNDIIERYIFNRLSTEERNRFETLLSSHSEVQDDMNMTAMIVSAVRQKERLELKERLQEKIQSAGSAKIISWNSRKPVHVGLWKIVKLAAAVTMVAGGTWIIYHLFTTQQEMSPVTKDEPKTIETPTRHTPIFTPKEEKISEYKEKSDTQKSNGKPRKSLTIIDKKPVLVSVPAETIPAKANQKFVVNALLFPKTNEVKVPLRLIKENKDIETRIFFKNPIDLSAVNIQQTCLDTFGTLQWFYVYYEHQILNVYLDNAKYLSVFRNARLQEEPDKLTLQLEKNNYTIVLQGPDKFKKAIINK